MLAIVKTKSNFRGLNGKSLPIVEVVNTRVSCKVWDEEFQKYIVVDFTIKEVERFGNVNEQPFMGRD